MASGFERWQTWHKWLTQVPALNDSVNGIIARSYIVTNGNLEEVEFISGASKQEIFQVYELLTENNLINDNSVDEGEGESEDMPVVTQAKKKPRTFTRDEMVAFTKKKLAAVNKGIRFVGLKNNVLTCEYAGRQFKVFISSSRDYEVFRKPVDRDWFRISAWNKGSKDMFSTSDFYALLVKADSQTQYVTESEDKIEGVFVNQEEMNQWLSQKVPVASGMINFYVHFQQLPGGGRASITVKDDREAPALPLTSLFQKGWTIR